MLGTRLASSAADIAAAQRLRYDVFVSERGAKSHAFKGADGREADQFDAHASHLLLEDTSRPQGDQIVGTYRLMSRVQADQAGGFYSAREYDLSPILGSDRPVLELGRSCLHPAYRRGPGLMLLWQGLADLIETQQVELLFGVASFGGTDPAEHAAPLAYLHHFHPAPEGLRITALGPQARPLDTIPRADLDRKAALAAMPPLIKAYLRLGAGVGEGAFVDHSFNTTDVFMVAQTTAIRARQKAQGRAGLPA